MSPDYLSRDNVLVVSFGDDPANDTNAYQALTALKELDSQDQITIAGAAVVTRDPDDRVEVKSEVANDPYIGTASGSIIGLLLGIIGGPLGVLLGGTYGMLVGSLFDIDDVETTESVLCEISTQVHATRTAVLAQVTEQSPEVIDAAMERLGGDVMTARRRGRAGDRGGAGGAAQGRARVNQDRRTCQGGGAEVKGSSRRRPRGRLDTAWMRTS